MARLYQHIVYLLADCKNDDMGLMRGIVIVDHTPNWSVDFADEAERIRDALVPYSLEIHHIGSTAVPGLAAKPVIDMLLVVSDLRQLDSRKSVWIELGYQAKGELGIAGRRFYCKGPDHARTHHVHAFPGGHVEIKRHLQFRDFLREHSERAQEYAALKRKLARSFPDDVEAYNHGKASLIQEMLGPADGGPSH